MTEDPLFEKYFGLKDFSDTQPAAPLGLEDLGEQARRVHDKIVNCEKTVAPEYWELGRVLKLARKQLARGQWGSFLTAYGIHPVRACRARAIYETFSSPDALGELSVEEAYEKRQRRQTAKRQASVAEQPEAASDPGTDEKPQRLLNETDLQAYLTQVHDQAEAFIDVASFLEADRRRALYPQYWAALERLQYLGRVLGAGEHVPPDSEPPPDRGGQTTDRSYAALVSQPTDVPQMATVDLKEEVPNEQEKA